MTCTDDYYTIRIPRCVGWRTLALNTTIIIAGALCILASWHVEAAAGAMLVALLNGVARLCTRTPVAARANPLAAIWTPKWSDPPVTHGLTAQADAVRPVAQVDTVLLTELATMLEDTQRQVREATGVEDVLAGALADLAEERRATRLEAAAARMACAPAARTFHASTVILAGLGAFCASFAISLTAMVA